LDAVALRGAEAKHLVFPSAKVRFRELYRPPQVRWGTIGAIVDMQERPAPNSGSNTGSARFGDFVTPWIEGWQVERVG
jgi:hypothetical protein